MELNNSRFWRWVALIVVIGNVAFNNLYNFFAPSGQTIAEVTDRYSSLFTPAGYAFAIWGVIFLAFIIYSVYQLLPSQKSETIHDQLARPLALANLLCSIWILVFTRNLIMFSVLIIVATLFTGIVMFVRAKKGATEGSQNWLSTVPFALFLGWISVANIANVSVWLVSLGYQNSFLGLSATVWTALLIIIAALLGIIISYFFRDFIYPLVVVWASVAIYVQRSADNSTVATTALVCSIVLIGWLIGFAISALRRGAMSVAS